MYVPICNDSLSRRLIKHQNCPASKDSLDFTENPEEEQLCQYISHLQTTQTQGFPDCLHLSQPLPGLFAFRVKLGESSHLPEINLHDTGSVEARASDSSNFISFTCHRLRFFVSETIASRRLYSRGEGTLDHYSL